MAEQSPFHQDARYSDGLGDHELLSLPAKYLFDCVQFAQSNGRYPEPREPEPDGRFPFDTLGALLEHSFVSYSAELDRLDPDPGRADSNHPTPDTSDTIAGTYDAQQNHGNDPDPASGSSDNDKILEDGENDDASNYLQHYISGLLDSDFNPVTQESTPHSEVPPPLSLESLDAPRQKSSRDDIGIFGLAVRHDYDPLWMVKRGIHLDSTLKLPRDLKFTQLFYDGVIRKGDRIMITATRNIREVVCKDVIVFTHVGFSSPAIAPGKYYPDFSITLQQSQDPNYPESILACSGTTALVDKLIKLGFCGLRFFPNTIGDHLSVWRGDLSLGTVNYVRRAYKTWKKDTAAERGIVPR